MTSVIKRIRSLRNGGVLAERSAKEGGPTFLRFNLVYGFNGSGKSTLSRIFSSLQTGKAPDGLPEDCAFEFELSDGTILKSPDKLFGLQEQICVFNTDFIERNLRWATGTANSIFYISEEQAEAAAALKAAEAQLPGSSAALVAAEKALADTLKVVTTFKRGLARNIASKIHLPNRKYEAPQLQADFDTLTYNQSSILDVKSLDRLEDVARSASPPPKANPVVVDVAPLAESVLLARQAASASAGNVMVAELSAHPEMVIWAKTGHDYHTRHRLGSCLFCGETLSAERKEILATAFNNSLSKFVADLSIAEGKANAARNRLELAVRDCTDLKLMPELIPDLTASVSAAIDSMEEIRPAFEEIKRIYREKTASPTIPVAVTLPDADSIAKMSKRLSTAVDAVNRIVERHNDAVANFGKHQEDARTSIKRYFLAEAHQEYNENLGAATLAQQSRDKAELQKSELETHISDLRNQVRTHGPAAAAITKLVKAYLGHGELSIITAADGYELHRHGKLVRGQPSEGEKTALALCYFLSTLEADGRKVSDLIVVVDDPISSLDTKAMNYACALVHSRLRQSKQLFVMTHNQHCMNEFKKYWKSLAYPKDEKTSPTAAFLFLDVKITTAGAPRSSSLVEMSKLLREYDSEYHFLCMKVLELEKAGATHSEYGYLMPNVIRRVLELFLAFKVPGTHSTRDKLQSLTKVHPGIDKVRMVALERLAQLESHSDAMEDFIAHSSMTIEEVRDANAALLELMEAADENHTKAIRKQCMTA